MRLGRINRQLCPEPAAPAPRLPRVDQPRGRHSYMSPGADAMVLDSLADMARAADVPRMYPGYPTAVRSSSVPPSLIHALDHATEVGFMDASDATMFLSRLHALARMLPHGVFAQDATDYAGPGPIQRFTRADIEVLSRGRASASPTVEGRAAMYASTRSELQFDLTEEQVARLEAAFADATRYSQRPVPPLQHIRIEPRIREGGLDLTAAYMLPTARGLDLDAMARSVGISRRPHEVDSELRQRALEAMQAAMPPTSITETLATQAAAELEAVMTMAPEDRESLDRVATNLFGSPLPLGFERRVDCFRARYAGGDEFAAGDELVRTCIFDSRGDTVECEWVNASRQNRRCHPQPMHLEAWVDATPGRPGPRDDPVVPPPNNDLSPPSPAMRRILGRYFPGR